MLRQKVGVFKPYHTPLRCFTPCFVRNNGSMSAGFSNKPASKGGSSPRIPEGALVPRALADRVLNPECIYDKGLVLQGGIHSLRKQ